MTIRDLKKFIDSLPKDADEADVALYSNEDDLYTNLNSLEYRIVYIGENDDLGKTLAFIED